MSEETPRYGHPPIKMKRLENREHINNVGEFTWTTEDGVQRIMVALPRPRPTAPDDYVINYLPINQGDNISGKAWGWDGNIEEPTLTPSIHCIGHWHGWVRNGMLVEA